ncbi:15710_t:CDS:2 [Funneliformis geosporum]|uniref:15710_t:CDS:1 n=1 Tax=Funneliformis geosporum TaxID=1117311 RepID=A0A9W4ST92_9GLOM|nr:15710_t:CDS:2 [Funneliformis geosporum]
MSADNSIEWIENCIKEKHIKYYEYGKFSNIEEIGRGGFSTVYRANYGEKYFALKSFNSDKLTVQKIVKERIGDNSKTELFGKVPYINPERFSESRNKRRETSPGRNSISKKVELRTQSDIYSLGVLFWELSSGKLPFAGEKYDFDLAMEISKGLREAVIENTPEEYSIIYISNKRPTIQEVIKTLKAIISSSKNTQEIIIRINLSKTNDITPSETQRSGSNEMITTELSKVIKTFHERNLNTSSANESSPNKKDSTPEETHCSSEVNKENYVTGTNETANGVYKKVAKTNNMDLIVRADSIAQTASTSDIMRYMIEIFNDVADLYKTAQHCKNITKILMERIFAAVSAVMLQRREDLSKNHVDLHKLVQTLHNMKIYIEEIIQYDIVQKHLEDKSIENKFKNLCKDFDDNNLSSFAIELNTNAEKEEKVLADDVKELLKFQKIFEDCIRI